MNVQSSESCDITPVWHILSVHNNQYMICRWTIPSTKTFNTVLLLLQYINSSSTYACIMKSCFKAFYSSVSNKLFTLCVHVQYIFIWQAKMMIAWPFVLANLPCFNWNTIFSFYSIFMEHVSSDGLCFHVLVVSSLLLSQLSALLSTLCLLFTLLCITIPLSNCTFLVGRHGCFFLFSFLFSIQGR